VPEVSTQVVNNAKRLVRRIINLFGLEICRFNPTGSGRARLARFLSSKGVSLVFDVGANTGQYARQLRDTGYRGRIISFEPLSVPHHKLRKLAAKDPKWIVAPRVAVGETDRMVAINVAENSVFSSVLPGRPIVTRVDPASRFVAVEHVRMVTLDNAAQTYLLPGDTAFLKVDVQGYEKKVLEGAKSLVRSVVGVQLELSLVSHYEGDLLFRPMIDFMESLGLYVRSFSSVFADETTGRELQVDVIFGRKDSAEGWGENSSSRSRA
jgi:FkbM family methyltransferase